MVVEGSGQALVPRLRLGTHGREALPRATAPRGRASPMGFPGGAWEPGTSSFFRRLHLHVAQVLRLARAEGRAESQITLAVGQAELVAGQQRSNAEAAFLVRLDAPGEIVAPARPVLRVERHLQLHAGPRLPVRIDQAARDRR